MAFDGFARGVDDPVGFVAPYTPTASWLAALTRGAVARALDVGTGNGIHALLAAAHCEQVIATDVNHRALAYTADQRRDQRHRQRRDAPRQPVRPGRGRAIRLDHVQRALRRLAGVALAVPRRRPAGGRALAARCRAGRGLARRDDGLASVLVSWLAESEDEPDERFVGWLDGSGCDAWVIGLEGADPLEHAAGWNEHLAVDPEAYGAALDEWIAYFEQLGVGWISEGAVLLHRRSARKHALRLDSADADELEFAGEQIERVFASHARLDADRRRRRAARRDRRAGAPRCGSTACSHRASASPTRVLALEEGTHAEFELDPDVAEVIGVLDGKLTLGRAVERVVRAFELDKREAAELRRDTIAETEELLALGIAELLVR